MINFLTSTYSKYTNKSQPVYKISQKGSFHLPLGVITNKYYQFNEIRNDIQNTYSTNINYNDNHHLLESSPIENGNIKLIEKNNKSNLIEMTSINNYSSNSFINIFNDTKILLDQLTLNLTTLRSYQQKRIIVKFDEDENDEIDKQIKDLAHSMTNKVKNVEENIKKLNSYPKENLSENEMKLNINMKLTLAQRLKEFTQEFRLNENNYLNSYKEFGGEKKKDEEILDEDDSNNNFFQINEGNEILKKRDEEINVLLESIVDLSSLFKDMQNLVQEQGTILDRIDYNIDTTVTNVQSAHKNLKEATRRMRKNCFRNATMTLLSIIFVESVILLFRYT